MVLRRSSFAHLLELSPTSTLVLHAVNQQRFTVTPEVARIIQWFAEASPPETAITALSEQLGTAAATIQACIDLLRDRGVLTDRVAVEECAATAGELRETHGRDPTEMLDRLRRRRMEGAHPYWAVEAPQGLHVPQGQKRVDVLLLGDCDVQMETDFLRREAARRGIDLHVAASFAADTGLAAERPHDAVIIGALPARHAIVLGEAEHHGGDPARVYVRAVDAMLRKLRALTAKPILIDTLPEPTVQPLGFADRGVHGHRNRFRAANLALAQWAEENADVHLIDVAATLAAAGSTMLLDDGLDSFTHFGSPGWLLQRPPSELAAVHGQFPDRQPLADGLGGDPYQREAVMARAHVDALVTVLGLDRKKCVITDLDGVLWPGVLAETGSPFAWAPEIGGAHSFVGLYFGIHEALRTLTRRGVLLACVSKNDEATVRGLWRFDQAYPHHRLLSFKHFTCSRINWRDKADNIRSIADELGFALDAFVFIDDSERERERVRTSLPEVTVLGEDLFALRRILLTDPRLQSPRLTGEAGDRGRLVKAQLDRAKLRASIPDEAAFIASLDVAAAVQRLTPADATVAVLERVRELMARTTQFNATGITYAPEDLRRIAAAPEGRVFILRMRDRLADHGLVGVAVVEADVITNVVMSCRVIGLGGERVLLQAAVDDAQAASRRLVGRIVQTDRNIPIRRLYADHGFEELGDGRWAMQPACGPAQKDALHA